jgi:putative transposase
VLAVWTEVTNRMLIFGGRHLRTVLAGYETHYNGRCPHRSRQLRPPRPDRPAADLSEERIQRRPILGGLINEYERAAYEARSGAVAEFWNPARTKTRAPGRDPP